MTRFIRSSFKRRLTGLWDTTILWLLKICDRISDRLASKSLCRKPAKSIRSSPTSLLLGIRPRRQWVSYSCTATVLQMAEEFVTGRTISHFQAVRLIGCKPDGASLNKIASVLKRRTRCNARQLHSANQIRKSLKQGPVLASDDVSRPFAHAILLSGFTPRGFYFVDPIDAQVHWRSERRILANSDEFIAILP